MDGSDVVDNRSIVHVAQSAYRDRNLLSVRNDRLFVVACENSGPGNRLEPAGRIQHMHDLGERGAGSEINVCAFGRIGRQLRERDEIARVKNTSAT